MKATEENVPFLDKYQYKVVCVFVYLLVILWRIALSFCSLFVSVLGYRETDKKRLRFE